MRIVHYIICLLIACTSCVPPGDEEKVNIVPKRERNEDSGVTLYKETSGWTRRASLDLLGRLPTKDEIADLENLNDRVPFLIKSYANSTGHAQYFSDFHAYIWGFDIDRLSDFSRFINDGDAALDTALTDPVRWEVMKDPLLQIKLNMDLNKPYPSLFTGNFSIGTSSLFSFWGYSSTAAAWLGTPFDYTVYGDSRPAGGLISNQGFLSQFDSEQEDIPYSRTYSIFKKMTCIDAYDQDVHQFYDLDGSDMDGSLRAYAANNKKCAGCHRSIDEAAVLFSGLASGGTFGAFSSYNPSSNAIITRYLGREVADLNSLATLMGINPAVHRCHLKRIFESIIQRRFNTDFDTHTLNIMHSSFVSSGYRLTSVLPSLLETKLYRIAPFAKSTSAKQAKLLTGSRYLNRTQWIGIIRQFGLNPDDFELSPYLNASQLEWSEWRSYFPQGPYWHAFKRVAEQFSSIIIEQELSDTSNSDNRNVFTNLADDFYETTEADEIKTQISELLLIFTSQDLDIEDAKIKALYTLWTKVRDDDNAADHRQAWLVVVRAILLSNDFLVY